MTPRWPKRTQSNGRFQNPMDWWLWMVFLPAIAPTTPQFNAAVGGTVFLHGNTLARPDQRIDWDLVASGSIIATRLPGLNPTYGGRCAGNKCMLFANGTLHVDQITSSDNTTFSVTLSLAIQTINEKVQLTVYHRLTSPSLNASINIRPVNGTNLNLRCDAGSQVVHSIYFFRNDLLLSCNSAHMSCNRSSPYLYFNPILDSDTGIYSCAIENPVGNNSSSGIYLNVAVNVSAVTLRSNTTRPAIAEEEAVSLICSSFGTDLGYNWTLKGSPLPETPRYQLINNGSTLVISPVSRSDEGAFTCRVSNYLNSELSNPLNLTWSPDGHIKCGAERLEQSVKFSCSWTGGYPPAVVNLVYNNFNQIGLDQMITDVPLYLFALGTQLSCNASHGGSSESCLLMIDTPQAPGFVNNSVKETNTGSSTFISVNLNNSYTRAAQIFPATFSWFHLNPSPSELFNSESISITYSEFSSFLIIHSMSQEFSGQYMCKAQNAMGSNTFTFTLNVKEEESLSGGATAGIVLGSIAIVAWIGLVLFFIIKKKTFWKKNDNNIRSEPMTFTRKEEDSASYDCEWRSQNQKGSKKTDKDQRDDGNSYTEPGARPAAGVQNRTNFSNQSVAEDSEGSTYANETPEVIYSTPDSETYSTYKNSEEFPRPSRPAPAPPVALRRNPPINED
ncbi:V-set and immunoglobulin domain-containing protein 10-like [Dendropsophus ebraccatus]|uniref:V-set and immunoglobulin domain-containing protein 10-like n=1 Tax=Dendropsophus ebraccatus TaxID=150705 RepID=UPI0038312585